MQFKKLYKKHLEQKHKEDSIVPKFSTFPFRLDQTFGIWSGGKYWQKCVASHVKLRFFEYPGKSGADPGGGPGGPGPPDHQK